MKKNKKKAKNKKDKIIGKVPENKEYLPCGAGKNPQIKSRVEKNEQKRAELGKRTNIDEIIHLYIE